MKIDITNQNNEKIAVIVKTPKNPKGLAFIIHGIGGHKEHAFIETIVQVFYEKNYAVVAWDARKTKGESDGELIDATLSNYYEDLETVIEWASKQEWYQEPFIMGGHSLGAACAVLFTDKYPQKVKALAPFSLFISGKRFEADFNQAEFAVWKKNKIREWVSSSRPDYVKHLRWDFMMDAYRYNLFNNVQNITMPVLMMVGSKDDVTPLDLQQQFLEAIPTEDKRLCVVEGSDHSFTGKEYLVKAKAFIKEWLDSLK